MKIPSEWVLLAEVEKALSNLSLSLPQVYEIETDLMGLASAIKTSHMANHLFDQLEIRRCSLVEREVALSQEAFQVGSEIERLRLQMHTLTFEEAAEKILELGKRVDQLVLKGPSTHHLQEAIERFKAEMEHLHFAFVFPILDELEGDSFQLNMSHFLTQVARELSESGTFQAFEKLSPRQREEVSNLLGSGASPEGLAHGIELYLASLLSQAHVAESYFHGRETVDGEFDRLPEEVRRRVEQLEKQCDLLRTEALMQNLEERMGF